jgi:hypothetical protein
VTRHKGGQALGHPAQVFEMKQMASPGEHERLGVGQPFEQQLLPLPEAYVRSVSDNR